MQLVCNGGTVLSWYDDGVSVPMAAFPGATLQAYAGAITDLARVGPAPVPVPGQRAPDTRPYAAPAVDLSAYATAALASKFATGETFNVAASGQPSVNVLCDGTNDTRADLGLLALYGQQNPTGTKTWLDNKGVATVLTGAQLVTLTTLVGTWVSDCYPELASVLAGVASGSITTTAAIDQAFAAVTA